MDPHSFIARAEAQRWLGIAEKLLMGHDLVGSKTFAIRARESDPRLEAADQILAIADTLLAAEKRVVGSNGAQQPDYYAVLQLVRFVPDTEHIASQYRRLAVILNPHQNRFPYSEQAFQLVNDAWAVLSNPMRKSIYDSELDLPNQQQQQQMNHIGFNLEQHHHQNQQPQHHHHQQQQHHNFFSLNHMAGSGHEPELGDTFQTRLQQRNHNQQQQHQQQHQQLQQHNFLSQPNPVRSPPVVPVVREQEHLFQQQREHENLFQPQVQPFQITSVAQQQPRPQPQPPPAPQQPPFSWPQAPPPSQPQPQPWQQQKPQAQPLPPQAPTPPPQAPAPPPPAAPPLQPLQPQPHQQVHEEQQEEEEEESLEQNADPVHLPSEVNHNNGVREEEEEIVIEPEEAVEDEDEDEDVDESPTFWTACPYCLYMYEYPRVYADCTLRCDNCKRAFQAVPVPSPPPILEGQEAYFCCWGSFPIGVSISHLEKKNNSNWTPFSPFLDVSSNIQANLNEANLNEVNLNEVNLDEGNLNDTVPKKSRNWGPRIYIDDVTDDIFTGVVSEPSDDSDVEWGSTKKKKGKRMKKDKGRKRGAKGRSVRARDTRNTTGENLQNSDNMQEDEDEEVATVPLAESSKKPVGSNPRRQSGRVAKELGKLDLNVEFNNNEGEEAGPRVNVGNRGNGEGEEENIEGIGFFEGLDEFLSSLPILSVVNDEKGKAA